MKTISLLFLSFLLGAIPAAAIPSDGSFGVAPAVSAPPPAVIQAHPALWHVQGKLGDVYLFGSIHALPANLQWHTPQIRKAMADSDVFVFEVANDADTMKRVQGLIATKGTLPAGQSLRAELTPAAQADYDAALGATGLPLFAIDNKRPWLAALVLTVAQMIHDHYDPGAGVDRAVMGQAMTGQKPMRYLETIEQQFALLMPADDKLELSEFESGLKDFHSQQDELGPLVDAWSHGDPARIDKLMNADLAAYPDAKKALLDDRNRRWALQIETMLLEKRTFFITVGAGHLAGPAGVPTLLRRAGYRVEGP